MATIHIRPAIADDAEEAATVLRASITELCVEDHQNDEYTLNRWLRNKTPEMFRQWLANANNHIVVAGVHNRICGVGLITKQGDLHLCYVMPGMQGRGIGHDLLLSLEVQANKWHLQQIRLISTTLARAFYEKHGYAPDGEPKPGHSCPASRIGE